MDKGIFSPKLMAGRRSAVLLLALALSAMIALPACSSSEQSGSSGSGASVSEQAAIDVTVVVLADEEAGVKSQEVAVSIPEGATAYDALVESGIEVTASDSEFGKYIEAIAGVAGTDSTGWVYTVNGEQVMESADSLVLKAGDSVEWFITSW